jgi:hypothetical protein
MSNNNASLFIRRLQRALTYKSHRLVKLEKEIKDLRRICERADEITCDCTTTDTKVVEKLLDLFDKSRDFYMVTKGKTTLGRQYD